MRAVAYVRVSSRSQTLRSQADAIRRAAHARGDRIACWYAEKATASTTQREALARLRSDIRGGAVRRVYVFRLDRLSRSGIRDMFDVVDEMRAYGVKLVTVADSFTLEGPHADMVLAALAYCAQMERAAIGERVHAARVRIEAAGGTWGRPRKIDPGTLERIRDLQARGYSVRRIAVAVKISKTTVATALSGKGHYDQRRCARAKTMALPYR